MNPISWLKYHLSHIKEESWHFQITKTVWGINAYTGHACTYVWLRLFPALFMMGIMFSFVLAICVFLAFFGFVFTLFEPKSDSTERYRDNFVYPHRMLPNGKKIPIAPWQIAVIGLVLYFGIQKTDVAITAVIYTAVAIATVLAVGVIGYIIVKSWNTPILTAGRNIISSSWDKVCPTLVVERKPIQLGGEPE